MNINEKINKNIIILYRYIVVIVLGGQHKAIFMRSSIS